MILTDVENAKDLALLQFLLTQEEGASVVIYCPNCDFGGPAQRVDHQTGDGRDIVMFGENAVDCLAKILRERLKEKDRSWYEVASKAISKTMPDFGLELHRIFMGE